MPEVPVGSTIEAVVAGHVCLDIFPAIGAVSSLEKLLVPGKLVEVGPASLAMGGAVSNTGVALHKLGASTLLRGMVGDDSFGQIILNLLRAHSRELADGMRVSPRAATSYTVVISPAGADRCFLHCPGANDEFGAEDADCELLGGARLFHFGYPPLMKRIYSSGGSELAALFRHVKTKGLTTSLDMARPDPNSPAGLADWPELLRRCLPLVDVFLPSFDELLFMLDRPRFDQLERAGQLEHAALDTALIARMAEQALGLGAAVVLVKLGHHGLYLASTGERKRLESMGRCKPGNLAAWQGRVLRAPCFEVAVAGTTGAGDCTIAGFLYGLLRGWEPEKALIHAVGTGAHSVEKLDAHSGVPTAEAVQQRIARGWRQKKLDCGLSGWSWDAQALVWAGPADSRRKAGR